MFRDNSFYNIEVIIINMVKETPDSMLSKLTTAINKHKDTATVRLVLKRSRQVLTKSTSTKSSATRKKEAQ